SFYYLLTGQPPFPGGGLAQKVAKHLQAEPPGVEQYRKDLPAGLAAIIRKMLAKRPEDRYQNPSEVAAALAPLAQTSPTPLSQAPLRLLRHLSRRRMALGLGAVLLLGGLIVGVRSLSSPSGPGGEKGKDDVLSPRKVSEFRLRPQSYLHTVAFSPNA